MNDKNHIIKEDARNEWIKLVKRHKKKQKGLPALSNLNTNAGNVEYNIETFNRMINCVDDSIDSVSSSSDSVNSVSEDLNRQIEYIDLEYPRLEFPYYGTVRDVDDWEEQDIRADWTYSVKKQDLYTFIFEYCLEESDFPQAFESTFDPNDKADWNIFEDWLDDNFDAIFDKYKDKILDNWYEAAVDDATDNYDPADYYVDWGNIYEECSSIVEENTKKDYTDLDDKFDMTMRTLL